ncbi:hypothetical protein B0J14DRAFT_230970 [Halenospora varia]|nr:hypothetical protein B0J14DRAFT_230970 [Halenospora varia]
MGQWVINATPVVNDRSNYQTIVGVCIAMATLMVVVVCTRLYVRIGMLKRPGSDDWFIIAAAVCAVIYAALTITQSRYGLGLPLALRPKVNLNKYSEVNFAGRPFYMMGILFFKVALCLGYLRILSKGNSIYRMLVWGVLIMCVIGHLAGTLILLLSCHPVKKSWRPLIAGTCLPSGPTFYGLAAVTILFDVVIFFLPIPFLWKLQMNNRKKYGVMGLFLLGLFTTICSIMRMVQIERIAKGDGNSTMLVVWGNIELNVGIILTSLPVLTTLFKFFGSKLSSKATNSASKLSGTHRLQVFSKSGGSSTPMHSKHGKYSVTDDTNNESQETILGTADPNFQHSKQAGIMKTVHVDVRTSDTKGFKDQKSFLDA